MIVINTVDAQRFTLNGIEYFKNFTPVVAGDTIRIQNTYNDIQLVSSTNYVLFTVDGSSFLNVSSLQSALLPVIYTRDTLGNLITEREIKGTRLEANVSGTYDIDLSIASDFHLTMTANTAFTFTNLPTGTDVVRCKLRLTGSFVPTFSQSWLQVFGDDYDGTKWNDVLVEISKTNTGYEKGELIFQQREDS